MKTIKEGQNIEGTKVKIAEENNIYYVYIGGTWIHNTNNLENAEITFNGLVNISQETIEENKNKPSFYEYNNK